MARNTVPIEELRKQGFEPDRVSTKFVLWVGAGLAVLVAGAMWWMSALFQTWDGRRETSRPVPESLQHGQPRAAEPALDPDISKQLISTRETEQRELGSYGWVSQPEGIARIPIQRAMEIVIAEGLPAWKPKQTGGAEAEEKHGDD